MWLIGLTISLFSIIKTRALECVSVINRKCMSRPKILDVNEGVGEALFYPYNVLVNKCSGSCDTINNPMAKLCVPGIVKRINMQVYIFLMKLNETSSVFVCFSVFAYFKWMKAKKLFKKNILIIEHIKFDTKSLEIKNKTYYDWDDIIYINDFNVNSLEIIKRESRIGANIYYTGYVLNPDYDFDTINPLYLVINCLIGYI